MRSVVAIFAIIFSISPALSQKYDEVGLFVGGSYFFGDVHSSISENTNFSTGILYRKNFNTRWAIRYDFRYAQLEGVDANSENTFKLQRNLSFNSNVFEFSTMVEFNFFDFTPFKPQSFFQSPDVITPYVAVGISIFTHNPTAELAGNVYELRPLETEGKSYGRIGLALPLVFGVKMRAADRLILGLSVGLRPTTTDYLDDASTRYPVDPSGMSKTASDLSNRTLIPQGSDGESWGAQRANQNTNDWFSYAGLTLTYNLVKNPSSCHFNQNK
jgi:hypothetical protein